MIAKENSSRYTPFVLLVETVDVGRAHSLYLRMYPLLQQAYQELGFSQRYFNDRLVQVIDQLLATPAPSTRSQCSWWRSKDPFRRFGRGFGMNLRTPRWNR